MPALGGELITLLSGGLDSTVLTAHLLAGDVAVEAVTIDYGQRHRRELAAAAKVAAHYGIRHDVIDLSGLGQNLTGSALTSNIPVPEGHYADPAQSATVVPNRNAILLMAAVGVAVARGHDNVATAVHAGDRTIYPDCRPEFITALSAAAQLGTRGHGDVTIHAPFLTYTKTDIVALGSALNAPMDLSWSCYQGLQEPCGRCGACVERAEAFRLSPGGGS
jgi:7-cyano-7-deazaguanine synthase